MWPLAFEKKITKPKYFVNNTRGQNTDAREKKIETQNFREQFPKVFQPGIGKFTKSELKPTLIKEACPKFVQPRNVPWALRDKVEKELLRLQKLEIVTIHPP